VPFCSTASNLTLVPRPAAGWRSTAILVIRIGEKDATIITQKAFDIRLSDSSGVYFSWENQDRRCAGRSEALADRATEALCKRFYDLESAPGVGICLAHAVVHDPAFDERQRRLQFDANQASAVTERVTFCVRNQFRQNQPE